MPLWGTKPNTHTFGHIDFTSRYRAITCEVSQTWLIKGLIIAMKKTCGIISQRHMLTFGSRSPILIPLSLMHHFLWLKFQGPQSPWRISNIWQPWNMPFCNTRGEKPIITNVTFSIFIKRFYPRNEIITKVKAT